ncbi:hypothetical protein ACFQ7O_27415, partial [Streptomyces sp. NPDC056485]
MPQTPTTAPAAARTPAAAPARSRPWLIQGGTGVGVSGWRLARAVSREGQLGVVSGTALDVVLARVLQTGDPGGHARRAPAAFPLPELAQTALDCYFRPDGLGGDPGARMRTTPRLRAAGGAPAEVLTVLGDFVEVWLAKEGHDGVVGVNYLEKIQLATAPAMFGAILAGVDHVLVGAGVPGQIPALADRLARCEPCVTRIAVEGDERPLDHVFDPAARSDAARRGRGAGLRAARPSGPRPLRTGGGRGPAPGLRPGLPAHPRTGAARSGPRTRPRTRRRTWCGGWRRERADGREGPAPRGWRALARVRRT